MYRLLAKKATSTAFLNMTSTNIGTGAWVTLLASAPSGCTAIEIFNPSGSTLQLSMGAAGHETDPGKLIPYTILPGGSGILLPINLPGGVRLSLKAVDITANSGYLTFNFFG